MQRWVAQIQYHGSAGHGWQKQKEIQTIQNQVESALSAVAAQPVETVCAGRTDAGVHAVSQIVHFDTTAQRTAQAWVLGANKYLPPGIKLKGVEPIDKEFHARFSARSRQYKYYLYEHPLANPFLVDRAWWFPHGKLSLEKMRYATKFWLGEQDFSSFRASDCQARHPVRRLLGVDIQRKGSIVVITVSANAFLHHMVRNMIGVLVPIGSHRAPVYWANEVLQQKNRSKAGITAPAHGLFLQDVFYPSPWTEVLNRLPKPDSLADEGVFAYHDK